jgi:hypothetical protein
MPAPSGTWRAGAVRDVAGRRRPGRDGVNPGRACPKFGTMKKLVELLLCFLHPLAVVLIWIDLLSRTDISSGAKLAWAILVLIPLVPFIYVLTGGDLW